MDHRNERVVNTGLIYLEEINIQSMALFICCPVHLPDPDGPTMATVFPLGIVKLKFSKTI